MRSRTVIAIEARRRSPGILLPALVGVFLFGSGCDSGSSPSENRCPAAPYRCECSDGTFSDSCGIQGACSSHGGIKNPC